jgi:hypothetical protein
MGYFWNLYATIVLVIVLSSAPCTFFPSPLSSLKEKNYHVYNIYFLKLIEDVRISCMLCSQYRRLNSQPNWLRGTGAGQLPRTFHLS